MRLSSAERLTKKINIPAAFDRIPETWSPHIAARLNDQEVRLAKIEGGFDWRRYDGVDELFFVIKGRFIMRFRDHDVAMGEGDLLVMPAILRTCRSLRRNAGSCLSKAPARRIRAKQ